MKPRILGFIARWWRTAGAVLMVIVLALTIGKTWDLGRDTAHTNVRLAATQRAFASYVQAQLRAQRQADHRACVERNKGRQGNRDLVEYLLVITNSDQETADGVHRILETTQPIVRCPKP